MLSPPFSLLTLILLLTPSLATPSCPLYGPIFPLPNLSSLSPASSTLLTTALANLTALFTYLDTSSNTGTSTNSYSINFFSGSKSTPIFEHSHTAGNLNNQNVTGGVKSVDGNSVFRIGSPTKVFSVFAWLVEVGDGAWGDSVTKYVPELAALQASQTGNTLTKVSWSDITIGELASHMAGIANDNTITGELTQTISQHDSIALGFPPLLASDITPCGSYPLCNRTQFFQSFEKFSPAFVPGETPAYSNIAFQIFAYALESITGRSFQSSVEDKILKPLGLNHTYWNTPPYTSVGVIPGEWKDNEWFASLGDETPAGGMYSSSSDLAKLGRSILTSSLISQAQTLRWLSPRTLTSDLRETVGYPWGLRRITLDSSQPYSILTAFNKGGKIGTYSSLLSVIPHLNVGLSILIAGDLTLSNWGLADLVGGTLVPIIQEIARIEARSLYAGIYRATSSTGLNSSITLSVDNDKPGILISSWISNSTDMLTVAAYLSSIPPSTFSARLYPTDLSASSANGNGNGTGTREVKMKAVFENTANAAQDTMFSAACGTWINPTGLVYAAQALDEFIFTLDGKGRATGVRSSALRVDLLRV